MKDLSVAPVYVNGTSGDDSNDGLSEQTAVKTIGRGISILRENNYSPNLDQDQLIIAAGTVSSTSYAYYY